MFHPKWECRCSPVCPHTHTQSTGKAYSVSQWHTTAGKSSETAAFFLCVSQVMKRLPGDETRQLIAVTAPLCLSAAVWPRRYTDKHTHTCTHTHTDVITCLCHTVLIITEHLRGVELRLANIQRHTQTHTGYICESGSGSCLYWSTTAQTLS